jgi:hypothetical protein
MYTQTLDSVPIWLLVIIIAVLFSIAVELGFRVGKFKHDRLNEVQNPQVNTILGASLGLLAFFLAFTFNMAVSRYDVRKKLVLDEANTLKKTYLCAQLLPAPYRMEFQDLLRKYIDVRAQLQTDNFETVRQVIVKSEELHNLLWSKVVMLSEKSGYTGATALFVRSLNDVFDLHGKRINAGLRNRIPIIIFLSLYFVALLAMALMGYQAGLNGKRSPIASFALVITFAIVMTLITDLERPRQNIFSVNQQAMVDLKNKVNRAF